MWARRAVRCAAGSGLHRPCSGVRRRAALDQLGPPERRLARPRHRRRPPRPRIGAAEAPGRRGGASTLVKPHPLRRPRRQPRPARRSESATARSELPGFRMATRPRSDLQHEYRLAAIANVPALPGEQPPRRPRVPWCPHRRRARDRCRRRCGWFSTPGRPLSPRPMRRRSVISPMIPAPIPAASSGGLRGGEAGRCLHRAPAVVVARHGGALVVLAAGVSSAPVRAGPGSTATDGPADRVELIVTRLGMVAR